MLKESQVRSENRISRGTHADSPPQIIMLLNDRAHIVWLNRERANSSFEEAAFAEGMNVHDLLHSGCGGDCSLNEIWSDAWSHLAMHDVQEWEISDSFLNKVLRCHLVRSPSVRHQEERRSARAILTVNDISDFREAHNTLISQKNALAQRLSEQEANLSESRDQLMRECEVHDLAREMLTESRHKMQLLARELTYAQENERRRIALDLHDGIAQRLGAVKYYIETIGRQLEEKGCEREGEMLGVVITQIKDTTEELRRISSNLSPIQLDGCGIQEALEVLCKDFENQISHITLNRDINVNEKGMPDLIMIAIYRVVQEAVQNISKHADANSVELRLARSDDGIVLQISDDGCGFDMEEPQKKIHMWSGSGLSNMKERVEASAGKIEITSQPGHGTHITAQWTEEVLRLLGSDEAVGNRVGSNGGDIV